MMLNVRLRSMFPLIALAACVTMMDVAPAFAQDEAGPETGVVQDPPRRGPRGRQGQQPPPQATPAPAPEAKVEPAKAEDKFLAITGGRVYTMAGPVLEGVTILAKNGSIIEIGPNVKVPDGAETIDASGRRIYPGLVALQ